MSSDATTIPLRDERPAARRIGRVRAAGVDRGRVVGAIGLSTIVLLSLLIVVMAADRPSLLSPTTHTGYFPGWMAGPLGGLWPSLTSDGTTLKNIFSFSMIAMYLGYLGVLRYSARLPARWIVTAIVAVHCVFVFSPPLALTDLFNYVNYGRMEIVHHLNPYTTIPILEPHSDPSYTLSNWHELLSPYGPLFTIVTFVVVPLGVAGSFWALKLLMILTSLAILRLVWLCAKRVGRDPVPAVALVGLNPIVLVWGLGGDHNDFLMVFCIVLAFYLMLVAREHERDRQEGGPATWLWPLSPRLIGAAVALTVATGLKASAAVLIPVVLAGLLRHRRALVQMLIGLVLGGLAVAAASLIAFGLHIPDLSTQSQLVTSESVPNLIGLALGLGGETEGLHEVLTGALAVALLGCCWLAWKGSERGAARRTITAAGWSSVALLVTLGWVLPWYVVWVLPLAALSSSKRLRTFALVFGAYLIVVWMPSSGSIWGLLHFHPEKTSLGRLHQRAVKELLN
jgi:hypothetical protein